MEGAVSLGCVKTSVLNHLCVLFSLLEDEAPLLKFLQTHAAVLPSQKNKNKKEGGTGLDTSFALRTCVKTRRHFRSVIQLNMAMGLRQQALELALGVAPSLAREIASGCEEEGGMEQKKLWLLIAKNAALGGAGEGGEGEGETGEGGGSEGVAKCINVLRESKLLSIVDVLPFLPGERAKRASLDEDEKYMRAANLNIILIFARRRAN